MSSSKQPRRGKGRPVGSGDGVGKETLIAAAKKLLQELTPAQVTIAAIAREAGADPALVRYYFGSREALLLEVTQQIALQAEVETRSEDLTPEAGLEDLIHRTFRFTRSARYMQRLMAEELSSVRSPEVREKLRKLKAWYLGQTAGRGRHGLAKRMAWFVCETQILLVLPHTVPTQRTGCQRRAAGQHTLSRVSFSREERE